MGVKKANLNVRKVQVGQGKQQAVVNEKIIPLNRYEPQTFWNKILLLQRAMSWPGLACFWNRLTNLH